MLNMEMTDGITEDTLLQRNGLQFFLRRWVISVSYLYSIFQKIDLKSHPEQQIRI